MLGVCVDARCGGAGNGRYDVYAGPADAVADIYPGDRGVSAGVGAVV